MFTVNDLMGWRADRHPDSVALVDERGRSVDYRSLVAESELASARWRALGVEPGQVVALLDTNSVAYLVNLLGLARLGAVPALFNWRLTAAENGGLVELVEPVAVAAGSALVDRVPAGLPTRLLLDRPDEAPPGWRFLDDVEPSADRSGRGPEPEAVFALGFSSGTTGRPKAIPMRHESLVRSALVDTVDVAGMEVGARQLMVAPTFHLAGLANTLMGLSRGAELHLREAFDPGAVLADIEGLGIRYLTVVPAMLRAMVQAAATATRPPDTSSVEEMTYGASPIPAELVDEVARLFPSTRLRQFYGMTEIAGALTTLTPEDHEAGPELRRSAGRVNPGFEVKLIDPDGREVPDGLPGQIMIRGRPVMHGYWRDPVATDEALVDGWFASGDVAIRRDGYLTIMDRAKDMIVSGGENVFPAEVEAVLYAHPGLVDVAVIGVPDDRWGERVHAVAVAAPDAEPSVDDLRAFGRDHLAGYKLPRSLDLVEALPRNATGKLLKRELRDRYWRDEDRRV